MGACVLWRERLVLEQNLAVREMLLVWRTGPVVEGVADLESLPVLEESLFFTRHAFHLKLFFGVMTQKETFWRLFAGLEFEKKSTRPRKMLFRDITQKTKRFDAELSSESQEMSQKIFLGDTTRKKNNC